VCVYAYVCVCMIRGVRACARARACVCVCVLCVVCVRGCADDEGLNSRGDLHQCSPSNSNMERHLSGERVFINPP
jgi:hypothetical protein